MAESITKTCRVCGDVKPLSEYHRDAKNEDGLCGLCKDCNRARVRKWHRENPELAKAKSARYMATPEGRKAAREAQHRYTRTPKGRKKGRERMQAWYAENTEQARSIGRRAEIKHRYGLTVGEYDQIIARGCALCGTHEGQICLDHDHSTGKVRDALCGFCNRGLGSFRDRPDLLRAAATYLEVHGAPEHQIT